VTPETYIGYERLQLSSYSGSPVIFNKLTAYHLAPNLPADEVSFGGSWTVHQWQATADATGAQIELNYMADNVYLVLGGTGTVTVAVDGVRQKTVNVAGVPDLYTLISSPHYSSGLLQLTFSKACKPTTSPSMTSTVPYVGSGGTAACRRHLAPDYAAKLPTEVERPPSGGTRICFVLPAAGEPPVPLVAPGHREHRGTPGSDDARAARRGDRRRTSLSLHLEPATGRGVGQNTWNRDSGHTRATTLPTTSDRGTDPSTGCRTRRPGCLPSRSRSWPGPPWA